MPDFRVKSHGTTLGLRSKNCDTKLTFDWVHTILSRSAAVSGMFKCC